MNEQQLLSLHSNQRFLARELLRRGVQLTLLVRELEIIEAVYGDHVELLLDRDSSICPYPGSVLTGNKYVTKKLLERKGLLVPRGELFYPDQVDDALKFSALLGGCQVVKPGNGSHGIDCQMGLEAVADVERAIEKLIARRGANSSFIVEEEVGGDEYRVFITRAGRCAVLRRDPAAVLGDGIHSLLELADRESRRRMNPRENCLTPIVVDEDVEEILNSQNLNLNYVPAPGERIQLRRVSNLALGGTCEDVTAIAHRSVREIASAALSSIPGLPYVGVDLLSTDISADQHDCGYAILELNSNPGLHMHMRPAKGGAQDVASYIADLIFPETVQ